jgi:hypothetical protein
MVSDMQHAKSTILASILLLILAYFGAVKLVEFCIIDVRTYIIAAIIWLLCLTLVRKPTP